jgi:hypothetical protein
MPGYPGVSIVLNNGQVSAHDGTQPAATKMLKFTDFIGQPSWIGPNLISAKLVMRGDLAVGNDITLPTDTIVNVSGGGLQGQSLTFSGTWKIASLRHTGSSRAPDGNSWCTIIEAYNNAPAGGAS